MKKYLQYLFPIIGILLVAGYVFSAPIATVMRSILPQTDGLYYLGTTTPKSYWANIYTNELTVTNGTATTTIGTATTTLAGGFIAPTGLRFSTYASCTGLETDSSGFLQCGSDASGGTPDLILLTTSGNKYDTASTSGFAWLFDTGFVSQASSTANFLTIGSSTSTRATTTALYVGSDGLLVNAASSSFTTLTVSSLSLGNVLTVANGGSGAGTFTTSGVLFGNGTSAFGATNAGASSTVLTTNGTTPRFNDGISLTQLTVTSTSTIQSLWVGVGGATTTSLWVSASSTFAGPTTLQGKTVIGPHQVLPYSKVSFTSGSASSSWTSTTSYKIIIAESVTWIWLRCQSDGSTLSSVRIDNTTGTALWDIQASSTVGTTSILTSMGQGYIYPRFSNVTSATSSSCTAAYTIP